MPKHSEALLAEVHSIIAYEYADEAARLADTSLVATDVGKIAKQLDNNTLWWLVSVTPITWSSFADNVLVDGDQVDMAALGAAAFKTVQAMQDVYHSSGHVSGGNITDNLDGTISVSSGECYLRDADNPLTTLYAANYPAANAGDILLVDAAINYVYVEYNAGTPRVVATAVKRTDVHSNVMLARIYRAGTTLHINNAVRFHVGDHAGLMIQRLQAVMPFARESGASLAVVGTRNILITAGVFWEGLTKFTTNTFDSSAADTFATWHRDGVGGWTKTTGQTQYNNTQYDDGDGTLGTLSNNNYGVHWVFLATDSDVHLVYGQGDYTLSQAQNAAVPTNLPAEITTDSRLIGRIIFLKSAASPTSVASVFNTQFETSAPNSHNELISLQGGQAGEYYHFTAAQHTTLQNLISSGATAGLSINQVAHGLTVGTPVYNNAGVWTSAIASDTSTLATGLVTKVVDTDNFVLTLLGKVTWTSHGLTLNVPYYLSDSVAGTLTTTAPGIAQPILWALDANTVLVVHRLPSGGSGGAGQPQGVTTYLNASGTFNLTEADTVYQLFERAGNTFINLPDPTLTTAGTRFVIKNVWDLGSPSPDAILFRDHTITSKGNIYPGQTVEVICDGARWWSAGDTNLQNDAMEDYLAIGSSARATGTGGTAIGRAANTSNKGVAVGEAAGASNLEAVAIGYTANATNDNSVSVGGASTAALQATACGHGASASATSSIAVGQGASASQNGAVAIGQGAIATGSTSPVAIGKTAQATGTEGIAIGNTAIASGFQAITLGDNTVEAASTIVIGDNVNPTSETFNSIIIGHGAQVFATGTDGRQLVCIGYSSEAKALDVVSIGYFARANANYATAVGANANVTGTESTGIGRGAVVSVPDGVAIGASTLVAHTGATAVGMRAKSRAAYRATLGGVSNSAAIRDRSDSAKIRLATATTDATTTPMNSGGDGSYEIPLGDTNCVAAFTGRLVAYQAATGDSKAWKLEGAVKNVAGAAALLGSPTITELGADAGAVAWTVAITVTGGSLRINVTGEAAHIINWYGSIELDEQHD